MSDLINIWGLHVEQWFHLVHKSGWVHMTAHDCTSLNRGRYFWLQYKKVQKFGCAAFLSNREACSQLSECVCILELSNCSQSFQIWQRCSADLAVTRWANLQSYTSSRGLKLQENWKNPSTHKVSQILSSMIHTCVEWKYCNFKTVLN